MSVGHRRVDRWLLRGIEFCIVTHVAALGAMALVLRPGLDVVGSSVPERAAAVAAAPLLWRLGWACWQITAASDYLLSALLIVWAGWHAHRNAAYPRSGPTARENVDAVEPSEPARVPSARCAMTALGGPGAIGRGRLWHRARRSARWGLLFCVLGLIPDQVGEALLVGPLLAGAESAAGGFGLVAWQRLEAKTLLLTGTCGALGYTLMSIGWMRALGAGLAAQGHAERTLRRFRALGWFCWAVFLVTVMANARSVLGSDVDGYPGFPLVGALNAIAFPSMMFWLTWGWWMVRSGVRPGAGGGTRR